jgi:phospholipid transport system transporter-binding protein
VPRPRAEAEPGRLAPAGPGRFELHGDLGFGDAARVLAEGERAFGALPSVEVDLAGVTRVDSAGLAVLIEWSLAAADAGRRLGYRNLPPAVVSLAGISDVSELIPAVSGG